MTNPTNPLSAFVVPNSDPSHYTPSTSDVRTSYGVGTSFPMQSLPERRRSFDRWLTAHDSSVRAAALDEAAEVVSEHFGEIENDDWLIWQVLEVASAIRALKEEK